MSIIYDALKKVEKTVDQNSSGKEEAAAKNIRKPKPILIYIFVISLGLFAGNTIFSFFTRPKVKPAPIAALPIKPQVNAIATPVQDNKPAPIPPKQIPQTNKPSLILNGIFVEQGQGYVLINNQILKVGDDIQGATVEEITMSKVVLDFEGRKITLTNPR